MTLRYPLQMGGPGFSDYVQFVPLKYRANNAAIATQQDARDGMDAASAAAAGEPGAQAVILYMPNSTPSVGNSNDWGKKDFAGPLGDMLKLGGAGLANTIDDQSGFNPAEAISNVVKEFEALKGGASGRLGPAAKQVGLSMIPEKIFGATGAQFLAMSKGKSFNPNVELIYSGPGMRGFNFSFNFVPKNRTEADTVNSIIMNFKKWSSPLDLNNGMFEIPYVWQVKYMAGGQQNKNMNQFKKAACTSVVVHANPQTSMHVAHADGMPIETVMSLSFREVDVITRKDHMDAGGQGF